MRITDLEAYTVAVPFTAPIFSAYGVSYPARVRTFIRVHTDVGLTGVGEAGVSARVYPALIDENHPLASVHGSFNAVFVKAEAADDQCRPAQVAGSGLR